VALPLISQQPGEAELPISLTGSPNSGFVALKLGSQVLASLASGDSQDNSGSSHLIPGRRVTVGNSFQFGQVWRGDRQALGLASTHADTSHLETGHPLKIAVFGNLVQVLLPTTLAV
jgi:hypothetical protein